jgi:membrane-bound lytic murein transglycosylase B
LVAWAVALAPKLDIPAVALQAYAQAELRLGQSKPSCRLAWTTLAGLGRIESDHGREGGSTLLADGRTSRPIRGLPLDGRNGTKVIRDTDSGRLDGDSRYDRALGPMQFIPSTWATWGADGNGDGIVDPDNIFDAALAAGTYLCSGTRDLSRAADWQDAVLSYNAVDVYLREVFAKADEYGKLSRSP